MVNSIYKLEAFFADSFITKSYATGKVYVIAH